MADSNPGGPMDNPNDFTGGDHSWKKFIKMTWSAQYLKFWILALGIFIFQLFHVPGIIDALLSAYQDGVVAGTLSTTGMLIPLILIVLIGYKGLYQYWNDMKNGISR